MRETKHIKPQDFITKLLPEPSQKKNVLPFFGCFEVSRYLYPKFEKKRKKNWKNVTNEMLQTSFCWKNGAGKLPNEEHFSVDCFEVSWWAILQTWKTITENKVTDEMRKTSRF